MEYPTVQKTSRVSRLKIGIAAVALGALLVVPGAGAQNTVTQEVTGAGALTASVNDTSLSSANYSHTLQQSTGTLTLAVDDSTGSGDGWHVAVSAGNFSGPGGESIPASGFDLLSAADPAVVEGQAVSATAGEGPYSLTQTGVLDTPIDVAGAGIGFGKGSYTQALGVELDIPGATAVDTYTTTMVVDVVTGPEVV